MVLNRSAKEMLEEVEDEITGPQTYDIEAGDKLLEN